MKKESLVKAILMIGGGYLIFRLLKPKKDTASTNTNSLIGGKKGADSSSTPPDTKNAEIVAMAYTDALKAGEPPTRLTELNKEMMKEFGMRCYLSDNNQIVVCDAKGTTILTK